MSWARDLIQVPGLLLEIVSLLREQNSLHRELIIALTNRVPSTHLTTPSQIFVAPRINREYTAKDVSVVTREMRATQDFEEAERQQAPWRADATAPASTSPSSSDDGAASTSESASPPPNPASPSPPQP